MTHQSAIARLRQMPAMFRGSELGLSNAWSSKTVSHYLWLWRQRGLVAALGGHSDVYANLIVVPDPDWELGLVMAMPSATLVGIECLRRAGWTTQRPALPDVAIVAGSTLHASEHFRIERRSMAWFEAVRTGLLPATRLTARQLRPGWALVDLLAREGWGSGGLTPDDVDWERLRRTDEVDIGRAAKLLQWQDAVLDGLVRRRGA